MIYNDTFKIHPFVLGCYLGDGHINKNGILTIEHCEQQKDYVYYKYEFFKKFNFCTTNSIPVVVNRFDKRHKKQSVSYRFNTKSLFKEMRNLFYQPKKIIPKCFTDIINGEALAIWFLDDGGQGGNSRYGLVIDITKFNHKDQLVIQNVLQEKYHLKTSFHRSSNGKSTKLFFKRSTVFDFYDIIKPYLPYCESIKHKTSAFQ